MIVARGACRACYPVFRLLKFARNTVFARLRRAVGILAGNAVGAKAFGRVAARLSFSSWTFRTRRTRRLVRRRLVFTCRTDDAVLAVYEFARSTIGTIAFVSSGTALARPDGTRRTCFAARLVHPQLIIARRTVHALLHPRVDVTTSSAVQAFVIVFHR